MNSFKESKEQHAYLHSLANPQEIILSKIIYNSFLLIVVALLCLLSYSLFFGSYVSNIPLFLAICTTGSLALASTLTMAAGLSYKASGGGTLFSILSIPIIIPLLVLMITASFGALKNIQHQTFLHAEMYAEETFKIKGELTTFQPNNIIFTDTDNKERKLIVSNISNLTVGKSYLITGTYFSDKNIYKIAEVIVSNKKDTFGAWLKTSTLLLISVLLTTISFLLFPKFWKE